MKKEDKGLRFNDGKTRHDLLEPFAINELAKVFTKGAEKYAPNNWLKGMAWSKPLASLKRHLNKFENGEDFDEETSLYHMAHVAWNALAIVSYYKYHPNLDDRFKVLHMPKIGLDIDEVLADFTGHYDKLHKTGTPSSWNFDKFINERLKKLAKDKKFWMSMPTKVSPDEIPFEPYIYITARPVATEVTEAWLLKHGFPVAPVITVPTGKSKLEYVKESGVDYFVDDNYKTFAELNANGIPCFLFDAKHNRRYNVGHLRIKSLKEIIK